MTVCGSEGRKTAAVTGSGTTSAESSIGRSTATGQLARRFVASSKHGGVRLTRSAATADILRQKVNGETVSFIVNRNINYTNQCTYKCRLFRAFSKGRVRSTFARTRTC